MSDILYSAGKTVLISILFLSFFETKFAYCPDVETQDLRLKRVVPGHSAISANLFLLVTFILCVMVIV